MNATTLQSYEAFLEKKQQIIDSLTVDFEKALIELGDDVKYLSWFPSSSARLANQKQAA